MSDWSAVQYWTTYSLAICSVVFLLAFSYIRHVYAYWQRRGIDSPTPCSFPFGSFGRTFLQKCSVAELMQAFYQSSTEPLIGVYAGVRPMAIVRDPELIQKVLIKDFVHFHDRGFFYDKNIDPLTAQLLMTPGEAWKQMRAKLSPTFTSGKLKAIFPTLIDRGLPLERHLEKYADRPEMLEVRDACARFATNAIASTAFGIDINCIDNRDEEFFKYGHNVFELTLNNIMRQLIQFISPGLMKLLRMRLFDNEVADFMIAMVKENLRHREEQKVIRKDFFQLLVQIRNGGSVDNDGVWETKITGDSSAKALTIEEVAAQAFIFLIAGFETSSSTMSFCAYELAANPEVQARLHAEIDQVLATHHGEMTYESLSQMKYLDCCIDETLRKYPPLPAMNRECTKDYPIPGTKLVIEKGTPIMVPVWALHYDAKFYPAPNEFRPERFSEANRRSFLEQPWMPFGEGPRACIGIRLGRMQTKVGLISMLRKFRFELSDELAKTGMKISTRSFTLAPADGIHLKIRKRD